MKLSLLFTALTLLSASLARAGDVTTIQQAIVGNQEIYAVHGFEVLSEKFPSAEDYDAQLNGYLLVTAQGNLCTADYVAARIRRLDSASRGETFVTRFEVSLDALKQVNFDEPLVGCTAQGEMRKMRIPFALRDIRSRYERASVYRIPTAGIFGEKPSVAALTITLGARGWHVKEEGFRPGGPAFGNGAVVPAPSYPVDFDNVGKGRPTVDRR